MQAATSGSRRTPFTGSFRLTEIRLPRLFQRDFARTTANGAGSAKAPGSGFELAISTFWPAFSAPAVFRCITEKILVII